MTGAYIKTILLVALIIPTFNNPSLAGGELELDRLQSRRMALEYSQQIRLSQNLQQQFQFKEKIAQAAYFPALSASGLYFYFPDKIEYTISPRSMVNLEGGLGEIIGELLSDFDVNIGLKGVTMAGIQMDQAVYMGGRIRAAQKMAKTTTEMALLGVELTETEIIALSDAAFYRYITLKEKKEAATAYHELLDELVARLEDNMREGGTTRNDLLKARIKQHEAILRVQEAGSSLELARMDLCQVIGLPLDSRIQTGKELHPENLDFSVVLKTDPGPENRPEYHILDKAIQLSLYNEKMAIAEMLPQVGVRTGYNYFGGLEIGGNSAHAAAFSAMATVNIPIFNWNSGRNQRSVARLQTDAAKIEKEDAEKKMILDIARSRLMLEDAIARMNLTARLLEQAEENLNASKDMFDQGMVPLADLLEAQAHWQAASNDHIDALGAVMLQRTMYLKSAGELTAEAF